MWRSQAEAEGLTLLEAHNKAGYFGVRLVHPGQPKPYQARVSRGGKMANLGTFATAEEAALCVARSPEGRAAAKRAAAAPPLTSERGAAAGAGGGADAAQGRQQGGLLRREPRQTRPAQALPGEGEARRQGRAPGHLRHRRGGGAVCVARSH